MPFYILLLIIEIYFQEIFYVNYFDIIALNRSAKLAEFSRKFSQFYLYYNLLWIQDKETH